MRRQGLRQRSYSTLSEASWDKDHDSQEEQRASWWSLRSSYIPHSESRGEAHQSPQALQAGGDPIRETSGELRGDAKDSSDQDLVMICKQALVENYGKHLANSNRSTPLSESRARNLRRLMSNSGRRRRSRTLMLVPNLRPKVVPHDGSRLLLGLIVRARGRLVARAPSPVSAQQARP